MFYSSDRLILCFWGYVRRIISFKWPRLISQPSWRWWFHVWTWEMKDVESWGCIKWKWVIVMLSQNENAHDCASCCKTSLDLENTTDLTRSYEFLFYVFFGGIANTIKLKLHMASLWLVGSCCRRFFFLLSATRTLDELVKFCTTWHCFIWGGVESQTGKYEVPSTERLSLATKHGLLSLWLIMSIRSWL